MDNIFTRFLHNGLLCNSTCSLTGGRIAYWGTQTEKIQKNFLCLRYMQQFFLNRYYFQTIAVLALNKCILFNIFMYKFT